MPANFAVQVFFALSGWLIGGILLRADRDHLPKFYYNRATRIWIPYFIAIAVLYAVAVVKEGIDSTFLRCLFFDGTFTHNWFVHPPMPLEGTGNHFWSIAVEEQFYLAAPLMIVLLPFGRSKIFWSIVAAIAVLNGSWYGSISLGVLAAVMRLKIDARLLLSAALVFAAGLAISYIEFAPMLAVTVVLLAAREGERSSAGEFLGGISYPLYLYHWTGMFGANIIGRHFGFTAGRAELAYLIAVVIGTTAYLAIDRNVMRVRNRYYTTRVGKGLTATAYGLMAAGIIYGCSAAI